MIFARYHQWERIAVAIVLAVVAVLGLAPTAWASSELDAANRAFARGHYSDAARQYQAIIDAKGYSAPVLFDLGNAYLREGKPAEATLAYERARLLAPRDSAIATNLAEARKATGAVETRGPTGHATHVLTTTEWTWLASVAFWLLVASVGSAWLSPRRRPWFARAAVVAFLLTALSVGSLVVSRDDQRAAVVLRAAPVLLSPFEGAQSSFSVGAGNDVLLGRHHDTYVLLHLPDGRSGWVERSVVAPLVSDYGKLGT